MTGILHSKETFGTVDGPGVRLVLFLAGCPLRCAYCHNPDTQSPSGKRVEVADILAEFEKNRAFYTGGITVSGGEPLCQADFVAELFQAAKARGIHTALDTSGILFDPEHPHALDALLDATSLVLLDLKHMDSQAHKSLTGMGNERPLAFARYLSRRGTPVWIRHVLVPGITDDADGLTALGRFIATLENIEAVELLPYHTLGRAKYEALGRPYPLPDTRQANEDDVARARALILSAIRAAKQT